MIGSNVASYRISGKLGSGGMGHVWLAYDTRLEREVALKTLPLEFATDAAALHRFREEALALASLNHPNIATIFGLEETPDKSMVLVLERVQGETLAERLNREPLPARDALKIAIEVSYALEAAHERGIVHRDLKPGNIMVGPRLVKVLDFGLAQRRSGPANAALTLTSIASSDAPTGAFDATAGGPISGTPSYMSPEQVRGDTQDVKTDIFAFGCALFECLSGHRAFAGADPLRIMDAVLNTEVDFSVIPAPISARIRSLLQRCLAKDPGGRPDGMRAIRHEIEEELGVRQASALRDDTVARTPSNLPAQITSFVGREAVLADALRSLANTRVLTLAGIGGSGKTRLAFRLCESMLPEYPAGVWFIDVAPLAEGPRLVESIASTLGVADQPGVPLLQGIAARLAGERTLLLLDNAETHPAHCAEIVRSLLPSCAGLKFVITSREPLCVEGETVFTVPVLGLPAAASGQNPMSSEAVRLFVERAQSSAPGFELSIGNSEAICEICRRLDGIPLALELAAARVRMLDIEQIRARLNDRFKLLTRSGTAPSRQQTVLATIQWSWNHLLEPEQDLLRKLALFPGGWTLELATSVCSANGDEFEVLDLLTRLAERSLVVVQRGSRVRYRFLESVWRFALDRLQEDPDRGAAEERFVTTYAEFCKDMRNRLDSGMDVMEQLRAEEENALAAITLSDGMSGGSDRACEIASGLYRVWAMSGRFAFGRRIMEDILEREQPGTLSAARQDTLVRLGGFHLTMGAIDEARAELEEALEISGQLGLSNAAVIAGLGTVSIFQGRWEDALSYGEEAVAIYRKSGRKRGIAMGLHNIAFIEFTLQRPGYGTEKFEKALALFRELGDEITESLTLSSLAAARLCCGRPPETCGLLLRALDIAERQRTVRETMFIIEGASELLLERQRPSEAARLAGGAENLRLSAQIAIGPGEVPAEARLDKIRRQLPDSAADKAFAEGQTLSFEDLIRETRQLLLTIEERGSPKPDGESRTP